MAGQDMGNASSQLPFFFVCFYSFLFSVSHFNAIPFSGFGLKNLPVQMFPDNQFFYIKNSISFLPNLQVIFEIFFYFSQFFLFYTKVFYFYNKKAEPLEMLFQVLFFIHSI